MMSACLITSHLKNKERQHSDTHRRGLLPDWLTLGSGFNTNRDTKLTHFQHLCTKIPRECV